MAHNWRQTTVTMPARNFYETQADIFFPKVDFAGEKSGITGMEFPLLNYLIYLTSLPFGYAHWYGRLINLIVSTFGLLYFYRLVKKYFSENLAFNATFLLLFSIWFSYSRKIMPDTFSMSLVIAGFYYAGNYLDEKSNFKNLILYFVFTLLGILSKLPSCYILVLFLFFMFDEKISFLRKIIFSAISFVIIILVSLYYFIWVPYLIKTFGFEHFYMGTSFSMGVSEITSHLNQTLDKFYQQSLGFTGFILFVFGLIMGIRKKEKKFIAFFLLSFLAFLVIVFKGGFAFYHHSYYIIPFVPVMAIIAAYTVSNFPKKKYAWSFLAVVALECIPTYNHDFYIKENYAQIENLENILDKFSNRNDLIIINSGKVPTPMYFAHRKGWINTNESIKNNDYIMLLKSKGLKFIVILKRAFGENVDLNYDKTYEDENFCIYQI